jgi:HlyD family secretion protein
MAQDKNTDRSLRRFQIVGFASIVAMFGVFGVWSAMANIRGAVIAPSVIAAESFNKKIQHKEGGIVREILVKDGDFVTKDQPLVVLDDTETRAELGIVSALITELLAKRARIEAQRDNLTAIVFPPELVARQSDPVVDKIMQGQITLFNARQGAVGGKSEQLRQQIGQLEEEITGLKAQKAATEQQIGFIKDELVGLRKLEKQGLVPVSRVLSMEREKARLDGQLGNLVAELAKSQGRIGEIKVEMIQFEEEDRANYLNELREVESKLAEFQERQVAASSRLGRTVIKAPQNGIVYQATVHTVGGVIAPGEPLMLLLPEGDDLVLQAQVSPQDIDQIHEGQKALVRFSALKDRFTPEIHADVIHVAADISQVDAKSPPYYAVRLKLEAHTAEQLGGHTLKPGMPAEAFIQTGDRTPLSYLLKPLADQWAHTFREK